MSRLFCVVNAVDIDRIRDGKETEMKNVNQQYPKREHQRVADREDETESDRIYRRPARQSTSHHRFLPIVLSYLPCTYIPTDFS